MILKIPKRLGALLLSLALCLTMLPGMALAAGPNTFITNTPEGMTINDTVVTDYKGDATTVTIPEGVTAIGTNAFLNSKVTSVTLPTTLTTIGNGAFQQCKSLKSITIPESVTSIGDNAFAQTESLQTAVIYGQATLGNDAFSGAGLESITMNSVTTIGKSCFQRCLNLTSVSMDSVQSIGQNAFTGCTALTELTLPSTVTSIGRSALPELTKLTISLNTLTSDGVDDNAFYSMFPDDGSCEIVLTDVNEDVTLLENGVRVGENSYTFETDPYGPLMVTTVQGPANCTITNQTGEDVKIVTDGETFVSHTNSSKPVGSLASGDAYLVDLSVTPEAAEALELEPTFGNLTVKYAASVNNTIASVEVYAKPSNTAAEVTVNGQTANAENNYTVGVALETGENIISIVVTAPDGTTQKTYTVTVTRNDPVPERITIGTAQELMDFAANINDGVYNVEFTPDMVVELTADIDMSDYDWVPIGISESQFFAGTFDGNGHTISNLDLSSVSGSFVGLFGYTANSTIKNVNVTGTLHNETAVSKYIGGIVSYAVNCKITGCTSEFTITCASGATLGYYVGGIAGVAEGSHIENCTSNTTFYGEALGCWGGITGAVSGTELVNCVNNGDITITNDNLTSTGGITGLAQSGATISNCINKGNISFSGANGGGNAKIGGICAELDASTLSRCTNDGNISSAAYYTAGVAAQVTKNSSVTSCMNNGEVIGATSSNRSAAGIASRVSNSTVTASVSLGAVSGSTSHAITASINPDGEVSFSDNYYDETIISNGTIPDVVSNGSTGVTADYIHSQDFVDMLNANGGHYRLGADGKLEIIPPFYALTIVGSEAEQSGAGEYEAGTVVKIDAGSRSDYRFIGWTSDGSVDFDDPYSPSTTFTMPAGDVTITANWQYAPPYIPAIPTYRITVTDSDNGVVQVSPTAAKEDTTVTITATPDEGYEVGVVSVTDRFGKAVSVTDNANGTYSFVMPDGQVTVTVTFVESDDPELPEMPFTDVSESAWYYDEVYYVWSSGLMNGTSETTFSPERTTTRAQIVTILWRQAGSPVADDPLTFADVDPSAYYGEAVRWAAGAGIVDGYRDDKFGPDDPITREQFAAILYRYAQKQGFDVSPTADLSGYTDAGEISGYALEAMGWANAAGILEGTSPTTLHPQGTATRAQAAAMLMRFCER